MITKQKIRGTFLGCAIGDALGMPVETWDADRIRDEYGRITEFHTPDGHKWFNGEPAGMTTDDTQLAVAVAEGLIQGGLDMDAQVEHHVAALKQTTKGWGRSTKESIRNLANGVPYQKSGDGGSGRGNGVPMKIAPVGLFAAAYLTDDWDAPQPPFPKSATDDVKLDWAVNDFVSILSSMTHQTSISASCALAMTWAVCHCARTESLDLSDFIDGIISSSELGKAIHPDTIGDDDVTERFKLLHQHEDYSTEKIIESFGAGSCYCYNSLPFTFMFFLKNPNSLDSLFDVVSAGGDTDSNGAMVGSLLGALHGEDFFPSNLVDGVQDIDAIMDTADRLSEKLLAG